MREPYRTSTVTFRVHPLCPDPNTISLAGDAIRAGGLVAFPTETVYGLGANALDSAAVEKIFRAKSRPANDPLIVHFADLSQLPGLAVSVPEIAYRLFRRFAPGALTLVLNKREAVPANLTAGMDTVAVRMPDHPVALALINAAGLPIAAPSANRFSRPSPTTAQHVADDLKGRVDIILDGGPTGIGLESTILSLVGEAPQVLRPGGVSLEELRAIVPDLTYQPQYLADEAAAASSPGSMLKHYSPRATVVLFRGDDDLAVWAAMRAFADDHDHVGAMALEREASRFADLDVTVESLGEDLDAAAARLFSALRSLDSRGLKWILARAPDSSGLGLAIGDRLLRAAEGDVIDVKPRR
ncbi:MAG: L-threonylcarbamoyladenylate synthase [Chloroflexota bacterium]|nr:L-threonylcarbamoyladenylate synthase [Chloroflexota bacterium]